MNIYSIEAETGRHDDYETWTVATYNTREARDQHLKALRWLSDGTRDALNTPTWPVPMEDPIFEDQDQDHILASYMAYQGLAFFMEDTGLDVKCDDIFEHIRYNSMTTEIEEVSPW